MLVSVLLQWPVAFEEFLSHSDLWLPILVAIISLVSLAMLNRSETRYLRRASQLLELIKPVERDLEASYHLVGDHTERQLACRLYPLEQHPNEAQVESFTLLHPPWRIPERLHEHVQVYYDSNPHGPIVIRTSQGLLLKSPVGMLRMRIKKELKG